MTPVSAPGSDTGAVSSGATAADTTPLTQPVPNRPPEPAIRPAGYVLPPVFGPKDTESAPKVRELNVSLHPGTGTTTSARGMPDIPANVFDGATRIPAVQAAIPLDGSNTTRAAVTFAAKTPNATVKNVSDGDTAKVASNGQLYNCRIEGIDAPEVPEPWANRAGQPKGEEAGQYLRSMIENKQVNLTIVRPASTDPKDSNHGRSLCRIEIEGKNVSAEMVKAGLAWLYKEYASPALKDQLQPLQDEARSARRGLWADPNPIYPDTFRKVYWPKK